MKYAQKIAACQCKRKHMHSNLNVSLNKLHTMQNTLFKLYTQHIRLYDLADLKFTVVSFPIICNIVYLFSIHTMI